LRRDRKRAQELRRAIDCLPRTSREAMLEGIDANQIIVGAYTDGSGGVCPMLAAHRRGGRTSLASFARAWDRYTGACDARHATGREVRTLRAMLEASLWYEEDSGDLAKAVAELAARRVERPATRRDTGERNRTPELRKRHGWAWLRVFRRLDEWEAAMADLERDEQAAHSSGKSAERELERV
jgi:hypothetical protein